jgi:hypothetical protein
MVLPAQSGRPRSTSLLHCGFPEADIDDWRSILDGKVTAKWTEHTFTLTASILAHQTEPSEFFVKGPPLRVCQKTSAHSDR